MKFSSDLHLTLLLVFGFGLASAQEREDQDKPSLTRDVPSYPNSYSFSTAEFLFEHEDYTKAVWYCINLYSISRERSISLLRKWKPRMKTLLQHVKFTFSIHIKTDPQVVQLVKGQTTIDEEMLKAKTRWKHEILQELAQR